MPFTHRLVSIRDLAKNEFRLTVHTTTLRCFVTGIQQFQITLAQCAGIPDRLRDEVDTKLRAVDYRDDASLERLDWDVIALAFYYFVTTDTMKNWVKLNERVEQSDYEDNIAKAIALFAGKQPILVGSLIVSASVGNGHTHQALAILSPQCLAEMRQELLERVLAGERGQVRKALIQLDERKVHVGTDDVCGEWYIEAFLEFPASPSPSLVPSSRVDVAVRVKSRSRSIPCEAVAALKVPLPPAAADDIPGKITASAWRVMKGVNGVEPLPMDPTSFPLPPPEQRGAPIDAMWFEPIHLSTPSVSLVDGTLPSGYRIDVRKVEASQDISANAEGRFRQHVFVVLTAVRTGDLTEPVQWEVEKSSVAFRDVRNPTGDWVGLETVTFGTARLASRGDGFSFEPSSTDRVTISGTENIAVDLQIFLTGEPGRNNRERARLHRLMPRHIELRFSLIEGQTGVRHTVLAQHANPALSFPSDTDFPLDYSDAAEAKPLCVIHVDRIADMQRYFAFVYQSKDDGMVIGREGYRIYLNLDTANRLSYLATKEGKDEIEVESFASKSSVSYAAYLLVHREFPPQPYGVRIEIATDEGSYVSRAVHFGLLGDCWIADPADFRRASSDMQSEHHVDPKPLDPNTALQHASQQQQQPLSTDSSQGAASSGVSLSGFTVLYNERLGHGAFGAVYRGYDNTRGEFVAVKETLISGNEVMKKRLMQEFTTLKALAHPNIVKVHDLELEGERCRIFMEWLPSGSIHTVLKRTGHRMHEGVVRRYFRDALKGLAYLHSNNICHLDIKPANMLLTADGTVKLADFGTSRLLASSGGSAISSLATVGTPPYMPPEMITSGKFYEGSDMWALACSIVEMASATVPWSDIVPYEVHSQAVPLLYAIATSTPPANHPTIPSHLSVDLRRILSFCFRITIASRPSAAALLLDPYFVSDTLPLDAESESSFALNTVAKANTLALRAHSSPSWTTSSSGTNAKPGEMQSMVLAPYETGEATC